MQQRFGKGTVEGLNWASLLFGHCDLNLAGVPSFLIGVCKIKLFYLDSGLLSLVPTVRNWFAKVRAE